MADTLAILSSAAFVSNLVSTFEALIPKWFDHILQIKKRANSQRVKLKEWRRSLNYLIIFMVKINNNELGCWCELRKFHGTSSQQSLDPQYETLSALKLRLVTTGH